MTDTWVGSLWLVGDDGVSCEVINDNRTRHYQSLHPLWSGSFCDDCQCSWLDYDPCLTGDDETEPTMLVYGDEPGDETNPAPWFDEAAPASAEFLGWMLNTIDGFDYSHYGRTVNQRAADGSNLTPMRASGREITYTVIGTALSERGMNYGLHWLAANLLSIGGRCGYGRAVIRTHCDAEDITGGLYELRQVAARTAPEWTENTLGDNGCLVREARFTIIAGDPCLYGCRSTCGTATGALTETPFSAICEGATPSELLCGLMPIQINLDNLVYCCEIVPGVAIDSQAAMILIEATALAGPFAIELYSALPGTLCTDIVGDDNYFLGRLGINRLGGGEAALIDGTQGIVYFRSGPNSPWVPDDSLLLYTPGEYPCFPRISGCDSLFIAIRPGVACPSLGDFTVTVESVTVTSCTMC